jgi:uncharacterized cupredoxin-like copper-binding protein
MPRRTMPALAVAALLLPLAGCGSDDNNDSSTSTGSSSQAASTQASGGGASDPVVSGGKTTVAMSEFKFAPSALQASAGKLKVTARNDGSAPHEFVVIRTNKAPGALPTKSDGSASESGAVGEIPEQKPGKSASHTFTLKPGKYVFICNVPGHYKGGMYGTLTVK